MSQSFGKLPGNHIARVQVQDQNQIIHKRQYIQQLNQFISERKNIKKPNVRQTMIEKLKRQTQQLKQTKNSISTTSMSRLSRMKKIFNSKGVSQTQNQFYQIERENERQCFNSSRKKLIDLKNIGQIITENNQNQQISNRITKDSKLSVSQFGQAKNHNSRIMIQEQQIQNKINNNVPQKSVTKTRQLSLKKISNVDFQVHQPESTEFNQEFSRTRSTSQFHPHSLSNRSHYNRQNEMTLNVRKQLYQMESRQKIMQNKIRLIQNQACFKLQKRIKQNAQLVEKHKWMSELIQGRMERERERNEIIKRRKEERRLVHEGKVMKVSISKLAKRQTAKSQQKLQRIRSEESLLQLTYKEFLKQKQVLAKQQHLAYRMYFASDRDLSKSQFQQFDDESVILTRNLTN